MEVWVLWMFQFVGILVLWRFEFVEVWVLWRFEASSRAKEMSHPGLLQRETDRH